MSSRALRRLEKQSLESELAKLTIEEKPVKSEDESDEQPQPRMINAFAFLEEDPGEPSEEETEPSKLEIPGEVSEVNSSDNDEFFDAKETQTGRVVKKKKNKKNKKKNKKITTSSEDDIDKIVSGINGSFDNKMEVVEDEEFAEKLEEYYERSHRLSTTEFMKCLPLLQFDAKFLDPDREFRNLFGKLPEEVIEDADSTLSTSVSPEMLAQIKRMAKMVRGWGGKDRRSIPGTMRKLVLTKIRDDWIPTTKKDFLMEELNSQKVQRLMMARDPNEWPVALKAEIESELAVGIKYFAFDGKTPFDTEFFISVAIQPDHEALIKLLQRSPYHIQTLLQVSNILYRQGQKIQSSSLVERGLFAFDRSIKQNFVIGSGLCRLPFEFFLNRQFYLCIFRYIQVLTQKSTFFTALNFCKLLLSLSPEEDPYGVRHFIDFYAILSGEYQYLVDLVKSPLCQAKNDWFVPSLAYSVVLAHLKLGEKAKAKEALMLAYMNFPYLAHQLLEKIGLGVVETYNGTISNYTAVAAAAYIVRAHLIWDDAESKQFLFEELSQLINTVKKTSMVDDENLPENLIRYAILSGEDSVMARIPREFFDRDVFEFDILPPSTEESETIYSYIDQSQILL